MAGGKKVALVASTAHVDPDERENPMLIAALAKLGVEAEKVLWDDVDVDWSRYGVAFTSTTWDYHERIDEFLAWHARASAATRVVNSTRIVTWNCRKTYLGELAAHGVHVVPTEFVLVADEAPRVVDRVLGKWPRVVVKPVVSASAHNTENYHTDAPTTRTDVLAHVARVLADPGAGGVMLQPFVESIVRGETSFIFIGGVLAHTILKVPKEGDWRSQEEYGSDINTVQPSAAERATAEGVLAAARRIVGAGEDICYARVDMCPDADGRMMLMELELIEPCLYYICEPSSADVMARKLKSVLEGK